MTPVEICVGKSKYTIDCPDNEIEKIKKLAEKLNERVNKLSMEMRDVDEKTILMLCAIIAQGELEEHSQQNPSAAKENDNIKILEQGIEEVASHIEKLANKIKNY